MLPAVLIGGYLLVRKLREERIVGIFLLTSLVTICIVSMVQGLSLTKELQQLLGESPLFFFATIMFTEPLTMPPTQKLRDIYAIMVGVLFVPQMHVGPIYSTPELHIDHPEMEESLFSVYSRDLFRNALTFCTCDAM